MPCPQSSSRPLLPLTSVETIDPARMLLVEILSREHLPLNRWVASPAGTMPFVAVLTERPWELPAGLLRADAIEAVWHVDLPDAKERAEIWDIAAKRHGNQNPGFDNVILARASYKRTPAEIHAAYARAAKVIVTSVLISLRISSTVIVRSPPRLARTIPGAASRRNRG